MVVAERELLLVSVVLYNVRLDEGGEGQGLLQHVLGQRLVQTVNDLLNVRFLALHLLRVAQLVQWTDSVQNGLLTYSNKQTYKVDVFLRRVQSPYLCIFLDSLVNLLDRDF